MMMYYRRVCGENCVTGAQVHSLTIHTPHILITWCSTLLLYLPMEEMHSLCVKHEVGVAMKELTSDSRYI